MTAAPDLLLVEDNGNYANLILYALAKRGWRERAHRAADGAEGLDWIFGEGAHAGRAGAPLPKLVLLDLHLPKLDGTEVLARLRQDPRTRALPVFMMTASDDERDIAECRRLSIEGYLVKPAQFGQLVEALAVFDPLFKE